MVWGMWRKVTRTLCSCVEASRQRHGARKNWGRSYSKFRWNSGEQPVISGWKPYHLPDSSPTTSPGELTCSWSIGVSELFLAQLRSIVLHQRPGSCLSLSKTSDERSNWSEAWMHSRWHAALTATVLDQPEIQGPIAVPKRRKYVAPWHGYRFWIRFIVHLSRAGEFWRSAAANTSVTASEIQRRVHQRQQFSTKTIETQADDDSFDFKGVGRCMEAWWLMLSDEDGQPGSNPLIIEGRRSITAEREAAIIMHLRSCYSSTIFFRR